MVGAYGWPPDLDIAAIIKRLAALNHERAEEEKCGLIRGLRPEFQVPRAKALAPVQEEIAVGEGAGGRHGLAQGAKPDRVEELLRTLVALGQARALPGRHYGRWGGPADRRERRRCSVRAGAGGLIALR